MTVARPNEAEAEFEGEEEKVSDVHHKIPELPEEKTPEGTRYVIGQEIGDDDVQETFHFTFADKKEDAKDERKVVLADGFEASLEVVGEGRYQITRIWEAGKNPNI